MSQRYTSLRDGTPVVEIDATSGNETHTLTSGFTPGRQYIVMRVDGSANTVTVQAENGDTLNGTTNGSVAVPAREAVTFDRLDGAWRTVGFGGAEQGSGASIADGSITANKLGADVPAALAPDIATELALGDVATLDVGTTAGTVAAGDDARIVGAAQASDITTALALKAPLVSPTFAGTVTVPAGSGATDAAQYGQLAKHPDATTVATTVPRPVDVDARDFGVVANGPTDSASLTANTAAVQSFVDYIVTNQRCGVFPPGVINVNAPINFSRRPQWKVQGVTLGGTTIKQHADNVPIFNLASDNASACHSFEISDILFDYANSQPSTNTLANCIRFSESVFEARFINLRFLRGAYGMSLASGKVAPWGCTLDDLQFGNGLTVGAIDWSLSINAIPGNHFGRFFVDCANMIGPVMSVRGYSWTIDTIEFLNAAQGAQLMDFAAGSMVTIGALKLELATFNAGRELLRFASGCKVTIGHLSIGGVTLAVAAGVTVYLIRTGSGGAGDGDLTVDHVHAVGTAIDGAAYVAKADGPITFKSVSMSGGWKLHNNGSTDSADRLTVRDYVNGRVSANKGDADYTAALGDPNIITFQSAFTAQRTVNLPSVGDDLPNGVYYDVVFSGAINGANTALIKCGATTLATITNDGVVARFVYRRHASNPALGWILTRLTPITDSKADVQVFTTNGTWSKPSGAKSVKVQVWGAGGGGGSGRRGAAATVRCGGGGGGSGGYTERTFDASAVPSTVNVVVGAGGTAGAAVTADDTNGSNGGTGGNSGWFSGATLTAGYPIGGVCVAAGGGAGGAGGTAAAGTGGSAGGGGTTNGVTGGSASGTGGAGTAGNTATNAAGAGGSGGGITAADTAANGGNWSNMSWETSPSGAGVAPGGNGSTAPVPAIGHHGSGGAGGAGSTAGVSGSGSSGAAPGGGAGGSGASVNGNNSGAGGVGGDGRVVVTTYF